MKQERQLINNGQHVLAVGPTPKPYVGNMQPAAALSMACPDVAIVHVGVIFVYTATLKCLYSFG